VNSRPKKTAPRRRSDHWNPQLIVQTIRNLHRHTLRRGDERLRDFRCVGELDGNIESLRAMRQAGAAHLTGVAALVELGIKPLRALTVAVIGGVALIAQDIGDGHALGAMAHAIVA